MISIKPDENIEKCAQQMIEKRTGLLMVKENGTVDGLLSKKDIIWALTKKGSLKEIKAKDIMSRKIITINPSKDIYDALVLMKDKKKRWLPVREQGKIIGLISINDILRIEPSLFDIAIQNNYIREEKEKLKKIKVIRDLERDDLLLREGECNECGNEGILHRMKGRLLCDQCS